MASQFSLLIMDGRRLWENFEKNKNGMERGEENEEGRDGER